MHWRQVYIKYLLPCSRRHCGPAEAMPKFQISPSQKLRKNMILNHAATDTAVQQKLCPNFKFHLLKKTLKNMMLNHAAADTAVQRKLCPNFKIRLLKNLEEKIK